MAVERSMSFREVTQNQSNLRWKELTIETGGCPSSLEDVKLPESAGGYAYRDSGRSGSPARNRFIYWRVHKDVLELVEESLDFNLHGNSVRYRFQDTPILNGVSIHESHGHVVVLIATVATVHRLVFPHPNKLHKYDQAYLHGKDHSVPSIFADASVRGPSSSHCINASGMPAYMVHASAAWLTSEDEALFALATNVGSILLVKMPPFAIQGITTQVELRQSSIMQRFWTGLVSAVARSGSEAQITKSLTIHPMGNDIFVFAVCFDHKLRMWSCKSYECIMVADMLEYVPGNIDHSKITVGGEGHIIRKSIGGSGQSLHIGVFLSFSDRCQFCVFQPILSDGCYQLSHVTTVFCPEDELVDFCVTPTNVWTLWTNVEGDSVARTAPFISRLPASQNWQPVFMESVDRGDFNIPPHKDPRDAFLGHIFHPGRFSTQTITRALQIYRRSLDGSMVTDSGISMEVLRLEVTGAVEHEVRASASGCDVDAEEFYQLQLQQWAKFYSYCTQYHEVANKPMALFSDSNTGMITIVKKGCVSYVRPCHLMEHVYLTPRGGCHTEDLQGISFLAQDDSLCNDVLDLSDCLKMVRDMLTADMVYAFEQDMYHTQSPQVVANALINNLLTSTSGEHASWQTDIEVLLQHVQSIPQACETILEILDLNKAWPDGVFVDDIALEASRQLSCSHLFASGSSVCLLSQSVHQMAQTGLDVSRDLLLLLMLIVRAGQQANIHLQTSEDIQSVLVSRAATMVQAYVLLKWSTYTVASYVSAAQQEQNQRQLEILEMTEAVATPVLHKLVGQTVSVLELFLHGHGGNQTRTILAQSNFFDDDGCPLWNQVLLPTVTVIAQLLWPISENFLFPEFLACQNQYLQLQEYVRLTRDWCEHNGSSRMFLLGLSYLNTNECQKSVDCFLEAVPRMTNEEFLLKLLRPEEDNPQRLEVLYHLKVIRLLEQFALPHLVVTMATTAISVAEETDPNLPTLWSKVFKHQLELNHNEQAYTAMIHNPDPARRKDCLRQLLVVLCERGQLQQLVEFPYVDLHDDVVNILESRARSVDLTKHNYYDLLYAFHIFRANYRKAGSIMYEYGMRLGREVVGLKGIQRQAKCYLAALNALRLIDAKNAWIVKPATAAAKQAVSEEEEEDLPMRSPKRSADGEETDETFERRVEVLELSDLQREYMLVDSRLRLLQKDPEPAHMLGPSSSVDETLALLVNAGLFDVAASLCKMFNMPMIPIFDGMASRCVSLAQQSSDYMVGDNNLTAPAWDWLETNNLAVVNTKEISAADQAWRLLQSYLERYEDKSSRLHKCVAERLLSQAFVLPTWLIASYKMLNPPELLRLYLDYDLLEEAAALALEYIDAVMGKGSEYFGLKTSLRFGAPSVWLPYTSLDQLMYALQDIHNDTVYQKLYAKLKDKLEEYFMTLERVSQDTLTAAKRQTGRIVHQQTMDVS